MAKKGKGKKNKAQKDQANSVCDSESFDAKVSMVGQNGDGGLNKADSLKSLPNSSLSPSKAQQNSSVNNKNPQMKDLISRFNKDEEDKGKECQECGGKERSSVSSTVASQSNLSSNSQQRLDGSQPRDSSLGGIKNNSSNDKVNKISNSVDLMTEQLRKFCDTIQTEINNLHKLKEAAEIKASGGITGIVSSLQSMKGDYSNQLEEEVKRMNEIKKERFKIESEVYCVVKKLIHPQAKDYYSEEKESKIIEKTVDILQNKDDGSGSLQNKIRNYVLKMKVRNKLGLKLSKWVGYSKLPKELTECESDKDKEPLEEQMLIQITASRKNGRNKKR